MLVSCDVQQDADLDKGFAKAKETFGELDFVVHSIAYAPIEDLKGPVYGCSREGFKTSMDISVYSLMAVCKRAQELMPNGGSIITLTYLGGERVIPGYNVMGLCKAALESSVRISGSRTGPEEDPRQCVERRSDQDSQFFRRERLRFDVEHVWRDGPLATQRRSRRSRQDRPVPAERHDRRASPEKPCTSTVVTT